MMTIDKPANTLKQKDQKLKMKISQNRSSASGNQLPRYCDKYLQPIPPLPEKKDCLPISKCRCRATSNKCRISAPGCTNCCKSCKPCTASCLCKGICDNPHNNGGTSPKCSVGDIPYCVQREWENNDYASNVAETSETEESGDDTDDESDTDSEEKDPDEQPGFVEYFSNEEEYIQLPDNSMYLETDTD